MKLQTQVLKAVSTLFSVSGRKIHVEFDEESQTFFLRLPKRSGFLKRHPRRHKLILVTDGDMVGVSQLGHPEDANENNGLRGLDQEWEPLSQGFTVEALKVPNLLPPVAERIGMGRDEFYEVTGEVEGEFHDYHSKRAYFFVGSPQESEQGRVEDDDKDRFIGYTPGERVRSFDIYGADQSGEITILLKDCVERGVKQTTGVRVGKYVAWVRAEEVERVTNASGDVASLMEWFLNGPSSYVYPRYTARTVEGTFKKRRIFPENEVAILNEPVQQYIKADFAFIQLEDTAFVIQAVPEKIGPRWSRNIGIEYGKEWGRIPDAHEREMFKEIVSFIIGRPLLKVGDTEYDETGSVMKEVSTSPGLPSGYNIISLCQSGDSSPIDFQSKALEETLALLIPRYLRLRDELRLNEALYRYWFAKIHPIGLDLPVFAAAVEGLATSWSKSAKSEIAKQYLSEEEFNKLFEQEVSSFGQKLKTIKFGERVLNRIKGAHRMGSSEQIEHFYTDISLSIGKVEKVAMRSRHAMAHGSSSDYTDQKYNEIVRIRWAYQTLFERVFLKILGYAGNYIDRSSEGWQERNIDEPMKGMK